MATTAPFVKLLRQLSSARDDYRSGALDISWDGGSATLYVVFGQPNHAIYDDENSDRLEGAEALSALVHHLPAKFKVAPWRKEVVRNESLNISMDELLEPFAHLAGASSPDQVSDYQPDLGLTAGTIDDDRAPVAIRLESFPLLPVGQSLWSDALASVIHLDVLIPKLPTSLVVLTGTKLRAAAIIVRGVIIDAIWVDDEDAIAGEGAAMAIMGAREGTVSGYRLDDGLLAEAVTMLWRSPVAFAEFRIEWLDAGTFLASLQSERLDRVVSIESRAARGVAFFMSGQFVGGYTDRDRLPSTDITVIEELLDIAGAAGGTVTIHQRAADRVELAQASEESFHHSIDGTAPTSPDAESTISLELGYDEFPVDLASDAAQRTAVEPEEAPAWLRQAELSETPDDDPDSLGAAALSESAADEHHVDNLPPGGGPAGDEARPENPDDAVADDEVADDEVADDEVADDEVADDEAADDEVADDEAADDDVAAGESLWLEAYDPDAPDPGTPDVGPGDDADRDSETHGWGEPAPAEPGALDQIWNTSAPSGENVPSEFGAAEDDPATLDAIPTWGVPPGGPGTRAPVWNDRRDLAGSPAVDSEGAEDAGVAHLLFTDGQTGPLAERPPGTASRPEGDEEPIFSTASWIGAADRVPPPNAAADYGDTDGEDGSGEPMLDLDFEGIKADLVQIGVRWLGADDVGPVAEIIERTRHRVDDFVASIEVIKTTTVSGHDASVIRAMAREMHYYAAEALCGA